MDREKVKYSIERCISHVPDACRDCAYDAGHPYNECVEMMLNDALAMLKEQEAWIEQIADYQQSITGSGMHELTEYEKGKWDGLQIAWNIISEGR